MPRIVPLLSLLLSLLSGLYSVAAGFVNYTIDDKYGDTTFNRMPIYSPGWHSAEGSVCDGCFLQAGGDVGSPSDRNRAGGPPFDNTWHESLNQGSAPTTIQLNFQGSKIYIYGIIFYYSGTNLTFNVDGNPVSDNFVYVGRGNPNTAPFFTFKVPFYINENLAPGVMHNIEIINNPPSLAVFDFAVYSQDDSTTTTSAGQQTTSPTGNTQTTSTTSSQNSQNSSKSTPTAPGQNQTSPNTFQSSSPGSTQTSAPAGGSDTSLPNQSETTATSNSSSGALIGGVVGGVVAVLAIILAVLIFLLCRRRKKLQLEAENNGIVQPMPFYVNEHRTGTSGSYISTGRSGMIPTGPSSLSHHRRMSSSAAQSQSMQTSSSHPVTVRTEKQHMDSGWRAGVPAEQRDVPPSYSAD